MTPMCNISSGLTVGWAVATTNCDGTVTTIKYYNSNGVSQGTNKPATWEYCRPGFSSDTIYRMVQITRVGYDAIVTKEPNTMYVIVG